MAIRRCFTEDVSRKDRKEAKGAKRSFYVPPLFAYSLAPLRLKKKSKMFHAKTAKSAASLCDLCALSLRPLREMYSFIEPTHP
jgi:hypothetical protein